MTRDQYVEILKSAALSAGKKMVMSYLVTRVPFFALPIVNPILGFVVGSILEIAIRETEMGAFFLYIDLRTSAQGRAFEKAALKNYEVQKNGTPQEKADAEKELIDSFRTLVKFTG